MQCNLKEIIEMTIQQADNFKNSKNHL